MQKNVINFDNLKRNALTKIDKSKKGSIDKKIKPLLDKMFFPPVYSGVVTGGLTW